jgi:1,4-dihydroxy-2-naphthoate octaprenyltransferase
MKSLKLLVGPMRVPFLILTPMCVLLGLGTAVWTAGRVQWFQVLLLMVGALCAHISVNAFNEVFDFKSGLDFKTRRTPFSGGSGTLPADPAMARPALITACAAFTVAALTGLYFVFLRGPILLPIGLLGLILLYGYTPWLTRSAFLCLIAPGLGFGPLMVLSVHVGLAGQFSWTPLIASLVPFFLVSDLLLLNQFPDVDADRSIGRAHFPIRIGRRRSGLIYAAFLMLAYVTIVLGVAFALLPKSSLLGLLTAPLAMLAGVRVVRHADDIPRLIPSMGMNVLINLLTPALVGVGLLIARP